MKVENLAYVFAYIGALLDDDDLVVMNWMVLKNTIANSKSQLQFKNHFPIFKNWKLFLISEEMKVVDSSSNEASKEVDFYSKY